MKLRLYVPADDAIEAPWRFTLHGARDEIVRDDTAPLAQIPRADDVEAILPASRVLFARLKLPRVGAATIRELLPFAVEDRLLGDPSQVHAVAGRRDTGGDTTVAVVDRAWLGQLLARLRRAGLAPAHAWSETALVDPDPGEWHVVWGPSRGLLVDDRGVGVAFDHAGPGLPLALRLALDEAAARGERPRRIAVHAEGGETLPDLARWESEAGIAFGAMEPWEMLRARAASPPAIDLLQGEFAPQAGRFSPSRVPRAALALALAIVVLHTAFAGLDAWRLERERAVLEARREAVFRAAFPEAKTVVDPELQMRRNVAELRRTRGLVADDDFLAQLTRASRDGAAPVRSVDYANGRLQVRR